MTTATESESVHSAEAEAFYTIWASAGGTYETGFLPWSDLSPVDQKRWLFFYKSGTVHTDLHGGIAPHKFIHPDAEKYGTFDGDVHDAIYLVAEAGVATDKFELDYEAWKTKRLADAKPKWWQVWRKPTVLEDWEVDIVAYWDWVYEGEIAREEKRREKEVQAMQAKRAHLRDVPATINPHNPMEEITRRPSPGNM